VEFSRWWVNEFKTVKFPSQGTVFDYYIDTESKKFEPWSKKVPTFELDPDIPLQVTVETLLGLLLHLIAHIFDIQIVLMKGPVSCS